MFSCVKKKAKNFKYKSFKNSPSNWEAHLSCKHPKEYRKYREAKAEGVKKASNRERFCPSTTKSRAITGRPQPKITEHFRSNSKRKYSKQHPKQRQITQLLLKSIACASLPLSIVDKPSFRELIVELKMRTTQSLIGKRSKRPTFPLQKSSSLTVSQLK